MTPRHSRRSSSHTGAPRLVRWATQVVAIGARHLMRLEESCLCPASGTSCTFNTVAVDLLSSFSRTRGWTAERCPPVGGRCCRKTSSSERAWALQTLRLADFEVDQAWGQDQGPRPGQDQRSSCGDFASFVRGWWPPAACSLLQSGGSPWRSFSNCTFTTPLA